MNLVKPCLLAALALMTASCASTGKLPGTFVAPRIDCAAYDLPPMAAPSPPPAGSRDVREYQLYAYGWQTYAEAVLGQRVDTAQCLATLKAAGVIR